MKLVVTRPLPGADATVARIEAAGHSPVRLPLFAVEPVEWDVGDAGDFDALLLTSSNAVRLARAGLQRLRHLPVYAVGQTTAQSAKLSGLDVTAVGSSGAQAMLAIADQTGHRRMLWLAAHDRTVVAPPEGMTINAVTVYKSVELPVPPDFAAILTNSDAVLLHSARAAGHFAGLCDEYGVDRAVISLAAFSAAIADAAGQGWRSIAIAESPNDAALLAALASSFTARGRPK